ncbi:MAG: hypothetical protein ACOYOV_12475 [Bacteroidales bacterium]
MKNFLSIITVLLFGALLGTVIHPFINLPLPMLQAGVAVALYGAYTQLPAGIMAMNMADLTKQSIENPGGCAQEWYWAFWDDILTFPALPLIDAANAEVSTMASLTGVFVMKTGKKFWKGYGTLDTVSVEDEMVGPYDSKSFKNIFKCEHPSVRALLAGWLRVVANKSMVIIAEDANGNMRVVGNDRFAASMSESKSSTGAKVEDGNKSTLAFESYNVCPAPIYTGVVPLTPAV